MNRNKKVDMLLAKTNIPTMKEIDKHNFYSYYIKNLRISKQKGLI